MTTERRGQRPEPEVARLLRMLGQVLREGAGIGTGILERLQRQRGRRLLRPRPSAVGVQEPSGLQSLDVQGRGKGQKILLKQFSE